MKMVKSLLLGSAAGLFAVAGAQAADLPVKAKAVEYVKVCSAYGAGYFYIPGTDTCIKIGGYARFDTYVNAVGTFNPYISSPAGTGFNGPGSLGTAYPFRDSDDADYLTRVRGVVDLDARTATDYGTLRSYVRFGAEWNSQTGAGAGSGNGLYFERAFIQFAGFTFGYTQSFFDLALNYMLTTPYAGSNQWTTLAAYTADFGNGFSATVSLEDAANRVTGVQYGYAVVGGATSTVPVYNPQTGTISNTYPLSAAFSGWTGPAYYNAVGGQQAPDVVGNLRLSQAWGTAQIAVAAHQVNTADVAAQAQLGLPAILGTTDTWGWAVGGGAEFKLPFLAAGDSIFFQAGYADGALSYLGLSGTSQGRANGLGSITLSPLASYIAGLGVGSGAYTPLADAILSPYGNLETVSGWSLQAQFRHFWTPALRSAAFVGYVSVDMPDTTGINPFTGAAGIFPNQARGGIYYAPTSVDMWQVGANTIWSPVKNLDIGAEVVYSKVELGSPNQYVRNAQNQSPSLDWASGTSADVWSGGLRVQRNF